MYGAIIYSFSAGTTTHHTSFDDFGAINRMLYEEERELILLKWILGIYEK
jgi:hypothetical protein